MSCSSQTSNSNTTILDEIVANKRLEIAELKGAKPLTSFIDELVPSKKDMYAALTRSKEKPYAGFILECKKASPSKGLIRPDFDVKAICQIYDKYAATISVLTDKKYFQGSYDYLKTVTETVTCPVLNKDFFIDPYQVYLARYYGADAILLMLSVLTNAEYTEFANIAESYNLAVLTEVSTEQECKRAIALNAKMIGINNRNLRDLSTDISRTFDFAPNLPNNKIILSESGIYTNQQVRKLAPAVNGFLVGSSIMAEDNIDLACRKLIFGHNKVCGLTTATAAQAAIDAGAQFGGLIFAEKSPRFITTEQALSIVKQAPSLNYVGVFVDHKHTDIVKLAQTLNLFAIQLHGTEDQTYIDNLKAQLSKVGLSHCKIWKAIAVTDELTTFGDKTPKVDNYVLDSKEAGSGNTFNWQMLATAKRSLSTCFLAGGISQNNINQALQQLTQHELFGIDLNSGVESSPGNKCPEKLKAVFTQIRNY